MFTLFKFNNKYANKNENPREVFLKNNLTPTDRKSDCETPFRMPYNHYRKVSECSNCDTNEKILQDTMSKNDGCHCYDPVIRSYLNKDGKPQHNFIFDANSVLYKNNKTYNQNHVSSVVSTRPINGKLYDYSGTYQDPNDPNNKNKQMCNIITYKFKNHSNQSNTASSHRERISRLKYNNVSIKSYNNNYGQCKNNKNCYRPLSKFYKSYPCNPNIYKRDKKNNCP